MKEIVLSQGKVALVDDEDFEWLSTWKWCAARHERTWYAMRTDRSQDPRRTVYMHRFILNPSPGMDTDHRNGDGLDNQRANLRACTHQQNMMNQRKKNGCVSQFKGVTWDHRVQKWCVQIVANGGRHQLGYFIHEQEAAVAYNLAALKRHGEFARLNVM